MTMHKRLGISRVLFVLLFILSFGAGGLCAEAPPLPNNINIVPPGPNVSEDLARLSGKWVGTTSVEGTEKRGGRRYSDTTQHVLIVEKIDELGSITVIYARGDFALLKWYPPAFWAKYKAFWGAASKELTVSYPWQNSQVNITYKLSEDGTLNGSGFFEGESKKAKLHRE